VPAAAATPPPTGRRLPAATTTLPPCARGLRCIPRQGARRFFEKSFANAPFGLKNLDTGRGQENADGGPSERLFFDKTPHDETFLRTKFTLFQEKRHHFHASSRRERRFFFFWGGKMRRRIRSEGRRFVKDVKEPSEKCGDGRAAEQVPDSAEQVRDLLKFLPYFFRRAAAPPFPEK
jgi:hypothetical protein